MLGIVDILSKSWKSWKEIFSVQWDCKQENSDIGLLTWESEWLENANIFGDLFSSYLDCLNWQRQLGPLVFLIWLCCLASHVSLTSLSQRSGYPWGKDANNFLYHCPTTNPIKWSYDKMINLIYIYISLIFLNRKICKLPSQWPSGWPGTCSATWSYRVGSLSGFTARWFQRCFYFQPKPWRNDPFWRIFFRVETTN